MAFPILLSFFFLFPSLSSSFDPLCNHHDYSALLQFKDQFTTPFSSQTMSWGKNSSNCCLWNGVTCNPVSGHVIGLDLSDAFLYGQLTTNSTLFQLVHLQTLNLAYNYFKGSLVPFQFGDLRNLTHLNLSSCSFSGEIPREITQLSKLVSLDLSDLWGNLNLEQSTWENLILNMTDLRELVLDYVNMSSVIPSSFYSFVNLSSPLVSLRLQDTNLQGNITSDIFHLQNLQLLDLSQNQNLKGQFPKSNWSSPISFLDLSFTSFSGGILDSIGGLNHLNILNLDSCEFEGPIPLGFKNLTQLTYLNLGSNKLSGEISFLSNLKLLSSLILGNNNFSGQIPSSLSSLKHLTIIDFSQNHFNGEITNVFGEIPSLSNLSQLSSFDCSSNKLVGPIPNDICKLPKLVDLVLSHNLFNGTIPSGCYSSPYLETLHLADNYFIGSIRQFSSYSLESCDLSNNNLEGDFPESVFGLTNLSFLGLSSNNLSGLVGFQQFSKLQKLWRLDLSNNKFLSLTSVNGNVDMPYLASLSMLNLSSCNINNFPQFLVKLPSLEFLFLSYNKIQGTVPKWFNEVGNSSLHYLDLSHNLLTSVEHLSMRNIAILDLSFNKLQVTMPILPFSISVFSVSNNKLSGQISPLICNASSLTELNLSHNNFSGPIPHCLLALPLISHLDLRNNGLTGTVPDNFSKNSSVQTLNLNNNKLEGPLPRSLAYCDQLQILDVGENKIEGTFPNWLDGLPKLEVLILRKNKFCGAITSSFKTKHPFSKLRIFDISSNHFNGSLPAAYIKEFKGMMEIDNVETGSLYMEDRNYSLYQYSVMINMKGNAIELVKILNIFTTLDLSSNNFDGQIPKVIGELHSLKGLNFSHNGITGSIPQSVGNLKNLEWLDLSWNRLVGEIPPALTNLNFLAILNLSQNHLEGMIPRGKQFDTFLNDSYEGNSGLCGVPLTKSCSKDEEKLPDQESSSAFGFGWKPVAIGYGCGMVFGIFMGYIVFLIGKPQWLVRTFGGIPKRQRKKIRNRARANQRRIN